MTSVPPSYKPPALLKAQPNITGVQSFAGRLSDRVYLVVLYQHYISQLVVYLQHCDTMHMYTTKPQGAPCLFCFLLMTISKLFCQSSRGLKQHILAFEMASVRGQEGSKVLNITTRTGREILYSSREQCPILLRLISMVQIKSNVKCM